MSCNGSGDTAYQEAQCSNLSEIKIEFEFQCMFLTARFSILYNICGVKLNKNMQIKHNINKDRKKNLAFSVYLFFLLK